MSHSIEHESGELFLGEFIPTEVRLEERLGKESFHWFIVRRKNDYPITVRAQFVQAESDGSISVIIVDGEKIDKVVQFPADEVEGVFEGETPVEIRKSA